MAIRGWICFGCGRGVAERPWCCPTCRAEVCDFCFSRYAHCKTCAAKLTKSQMIHAANAQGFDFDTPTAKAQ